MTSKHSKIPRRAFLLCSTLSAVSLVGIAWAVLVLPSDSVTAEELTYAEIVGRMTDLERLAVLPRPGEACAQWSNFNRESRFDPATGKYVAWEANGDGTGFAGETDGGVVIGEMEGPGRIWRIWSAMAESGHVKIYLDGSETPEVDLPLADFFKGTVVPFNYPSLSYSLSAMTGDKARGFKLYVPMPYQESCKIVAEKGWGRYYHVTYSNFPKGAEIETFCSDPTPDATAALRGLDTGSTTTCLRCISAGPSA